MYCKFHLNRMIKIVWKLYNTSVVIIRYDLCMYGQYGKSSHHRLVTFTLPYHLTPWTSIANETSWKTNEKALNVFLEKFYLLVCTRKIWQFFLDKEPGLKASCSSFSSRKLALVYDCTRNKEHWTREFLFTYLMRAAS